MNIRVPADIQYRLYVFHCCCFPSILLYINLCYTTRRISINIIIYVSFSRLRTFCAILRLQIAYKWIKILYSLFIQTEVLMKFPNASRNTLNMHVKAYCYRKCSNTFMNYRSYSTATIPSFSFTFSDNPFFGLSLSLCLPLLVPHIARWCSQNLIQNVPNAIRIIILVADNGKFVQTRFSFDSPVRRRHRRQFAHGRTWKRRWQQDRRTLPSHVSSCSNVIRVLSTLHANLWHGSWFSLENHLETRLSVSIYNTR